MRPRMATVLIMFGGAIAYVLYANYFHSVAVALTLAVFVGVFADGGVAAFYAISPFVYPTVVRDAGVGLMIGFGRGVAILAPIFTGFLLKAGWTPRAPTSSSRPSSSPRELRPSSSTGPTGNAAKTRRRPRHRRD
jgi:hypothetical protein